MYDVVSRVVVVDSLLVYGVSLGVVMGGWCCLKDWVCLYCILCTRGSCSGIYVEACCDS